MKLNIRKVLTNLDGTNMVFDKAGKTEPLTLGILCKEALLKDLPRDDATTGDKKFERFVLTKKIHDALEKNETSVEMDIKEMDTVKTRIGMFCGAAMVGAAWTAIETA